MSIDRSEEANLKRGIEAYMLRGLSHKEAEKEFTDDWHRFEDDQDARLKAQKDFDSDNLCVCPFGDTVLERGKRMGFRPSFQYLYQYHKRMNKNGRQQQVS